MVSLGADWRAISDKDLDLRRTRNRDVAERLVERAKWVRHDDRRIVERVYGKGERMSEAAAALGWPVRLVRTRLHATVRRMVSPRFEFVAGHMEGWPRRRRAIAKVCVLQGGTMREACETLGYTLHTVRTELRVIDALQREAKGGAR